MQPGHFKKFADVVGTDTKEMHCPSINSKAQKMCACGAPAGMLVGQRLRSTVTCCECDKPRDIFLRSKG